MSEPLNRLQGDHSSSSGKAQDAFSEFWNESMSLWNESTSTFEAFVAEVCQELQRRGLEVMRRQRRANELCRELDELQQAAQRQKEELVELETSLNERAASVARCEGTASEAARQNEMVESLKAELGEMNAKLRESQAELESLRSQEVSQRQQLASDDSEQVMEFQRAVNDLTSERDVLASELEAVRQQSEVLQEELAEAKAEAARRDDAGRSLAVSADTPSRPEPHATTVQRAPEPEPCVSSGNDLVLGALMQQFQQIQRERTSRRAPVGAAR